MSEIFKFLLLFLKQGLVYKEIIIAILFFIALLYVFYILITLKSKQAKYHKISRILSKLGKDLFPDELLNEYERSGTKMRAVESFIFEKGEIIEEFAEMLKRKDFLITGDEDIYLKLGIYYIWKDDFKEAIYFFKRSLAQFPYSKKIAYHMGVALLGLQQYNEAIDFFRESIRLDFKKAHSYYNIGWALDEQGKYIKAIDEYNNSLQFEDNKWTRYNIACAYAKKKMFSEAKNALKNIINDPEIKEFAKQDKDFNSLRKDKKFGKIFK